MKHSAGLLLFRKNPLRVLLVHASGPSNTQQPWSLPKGHVEENESALEAAIRETQEECGVNSTSPYYELGESVYPNKKKKVTAFASFLADNQNPTCASWEIDKAEFFTVEEALKIIHAGQAVFIERFAERNLA